MTDLSGSALWAARMALMAAGNMLVTRGILDAEAVAGVVGGVLAIGGAVWSWYARKAQRAEMPQ